MAPELPEALREVAERAVNVLAPETDLFEDIDSAGFGRRAHQGVALGRHPSGAAGEVSGAPGHRPGEDPAGGRCALVRP